MFEEGEGMGAPRCDGCGHRLPPQYLQVGVEFRFCGSACISRFEVTRLSQVSERARERWERGLELARLERSRDGFDRMVGRASRRLAR